jgi:hypothetical protein
MSEPGELTPGTPAFTIPATTPFKKGRHVKKTCILLMILGAIAAVACIGQEVGAQQDPPPTEEKPIDETIATIKTWPVEDFTPFKEADRFHGLALQLHNRDLLADFKKAIVDIAELGADSISLSFAAYQEHGDASHIIHNEHGAFTHDELVEVIKLARSHKLRVILLPVILLSNPRGTEWRGKIEPHDPDLWWKEYGDFIRFAARAGTEGGAELLAIGNELNRMEVCTDNWRSLIRSLRKEFPKLKLTYQANWDRFWRVAFWKDLDYAMVTTYYTLAKPGDDPEVPDLIKAWDTFEENGIVMHHKAKLLAWQKTIGRPVIFGEIGYFSKPGTAAEPWNYCSEENRYFEEEQCYCYKAFLKVWADESMLGGMIFWEWQAGKIGPKDTGYTPQGKQAEKVLRDYFKQRANRAATSQAE